MLNLNVFFKSNNLKILQKFICIFLKYKNSLKLILNIKIYKIKFKTTKNFSILKSPHVHKTAQEQFTLQIFYLFCKFQITNYLEKFLLFFRYFKKYLLELHIKLVLKLSNYLFQYSLIKQLKKKSNLNKFLIKKNQLNLHYFLLLEIFGHTKNFL